MGLTGSQKQAIAKASPGQRDAEIVDAIRDQTEAFDPLKTRTLGQPRHVQCADEFVILFPVLCTGIRFMNFSMKEVAIRRGQDGTIFMRIPSGMGKEVDVCENANELWIKNNTDNAIITVDYEVIGEHY